MRTFAEHGAVHSSAHSPAPLLSDDPVFTRTVSGQHEVIAPSHLLDASARRLLMVVNGCTPLSILADMCFPDTDVQPALALLLSARLVEAIE